MISRLRHIAWGFLALPGLAGAQMQEVQIGLLRDLQVRHAIAMFGRGGAEVLADGRKVGELAANDGLKIEATASGLSAKSLSASYTARQRITLIPKAAGSGFRLRSLDHKMTERTYPGLLEARAVNGTMVLVNEVKLEEYVSGVVLAEAGKNEHLEYYKLQSVSCRTYALANLRRHAGERFELCDATHCQVYLGRTDHEPILQAARVTRGMVVVDADIRLIHATFHSNCGGETMNAEDLWSKHEPYLRARRDTFCLHAPHATWTTSMARSEWLDYLHRTFSVQTDDDKVVAVLTDHHPAARELFLAGVTPPIPLAKVRADRKFNSTFFSITSQGDQVVFTGRGFGHGVGLCQEGAMVMCKAGYSFVETLHEYYTDVHLIDLSSLDFFRDEGE